MAPNQWANAAQSALLNSQIAKYLASKAASDQIEFFAKLDETWFQKNPEEIACGLPSPDSQTKLDAEQSEILATAVGKRKQVSFAATRFKGLAASGDVSLCWHA
jgi:RNase H-fold protein (predicted Holliday junction resolvase)